MKKKNFINVGRNVVTLEIEALKKLKNSIDNNFNKAVSIISNCESKIIFCGVGKSGLIASKIASTLSSVGTPSFSISASDSSHGDLGSISKKDILILISYSGNTEELKNIIKFANRNKITLIGIVSKKNSLLYKSSDIKILLPEVKESGHGIVPTSSTVTQLAIGDAISIAVMGAKNFGKLDFKKFHPAGNLGKKLRTVQDLMHTKEKIPFIDENDNLENAIKIIRIKKFGVLIVKNEKGITKGIFTDGDIKRQFKTKTAIKNNKIKYFMTKNPVSIDKDQLAEKALSIMNSKKITSLIVYKSPNKKKTVGLIHIHDLLESKIT